MSSIDNSPPDDENIACDRQRFLDAERARWLSVTEAAYVLNISRSSFDKMLHAGMIPMRREGRTIRIHIDDLRPNPTVAKQGAKDSKETNPGAYPPSIKG